MAEILVVVDYQKDFVDGALGYPGAETLLPGIQAQVEQFLEAGNPVYFTLDTHGQGYLNTQEGKGLPIPHCIAGTPGWRLYGALEKYHKDPRVTLVEKPTFGSVELARLVQERQGEGPHEFHLMGLVTNICVISNAALLKAHFPESEFFIHGSLCGGGDRVLHENALSVMESLLMRVLP
jgi:nicotinamidase/pyrazinamidase